jgi:hypothetical protein
MLHVTIFLYFPRQNKVPSMPILSQSLKDHSSEIVHPFELEIFCENVFWPTLSEIYQKGFRDRPVDHDRRIEHASLRRSKYISITNFSSNRRTVSAGPIKV